MPIARVGDIGLNYRIDGKDDAPWITFTTGMTNDLTMWDPHVEALAATHRLLRFDTRGHGDSEATPAPYTLDMLIGDIAGLWDALGIERSTLVGLGLGGVVAIGLALSRGDRLDALVPVACRSEPAPQYRAIWPPMIERAKAGGIAAIAETTAERWFPEAFRAANPEVMEKIRRMILKTSLDGYLGCIAALLTMDYTAGLPAIGVPVLLVSGAEDRVGAPPAVMQTMAEAIPDARHVSLPAAGHICTVANPGAFDEALIAFLNEIQG